MIISMADGPRQAAPEAATQMDSRVLAESRKQASCCSKTASVEMGVEDSKSRDTAKTSLFRPGCSLATWPQSDSAATETRKGPVSGIVLTSSAWKSEG